MEVYLYAIPLCLILVCLFFIYKSLFRSKEALPVAEYDELIPLSTNDHEKFTDLKSLLSQPISEGWDVVKSQPGLQVYKKTTESSPIAIIRASISIPATSPDDVLFAIWDASFRREWDTSIQNFHVIETISDDSDVIYFYAASPMPALVSNREFLQQRKYIREKEAIYVAYWSVKNEEIQVPKGWVRANTVLSGYCIKKEQDGVIVEFLSQNDIEGKIPAKLINAIAPQKAVEWVKKLSKACEIAKQKKLH